MGMKFVWDTNKERINILKHQVAFGEATTAFADTLSLTISDPDHSNWEHRYLIIGLSSRQRLLIVSHTDEGDTIRIISARPPTRQEQRDYEQGKD